MKVGIWEDWINATEDNILLPFTKLINSLENNDIIQTNKKFKIPEEFYMNTAHAGTILSEIYSDHKDLLFPENYSAFKSFGPAPKFGQFWGFWSEFFGRKLHFKKNQK